MPKQTRFTEVKGSFTQFLMKKSLNSLGIRESLKRRDHAKKSLFAYNNINMFVRQSRVMSLESISLFL